MSRTRKKMVMAVFQNRYDAERAFDLLYARGYRDSEINVLMTDQTRANFYPDVMKDEERHEAGTRAAEGMGIGGGGGAAGGGAPGGAGVVGPPPAPPRPAGRPSGPISPGRGRARARAVT